jgi:hypothetical protein
VVVAEKLIGQGGEGAAMIDEGLLASIAKQMMSGKTGERPQTRFCTADPPPCFTPDWTLVCTESRSFDGSTPGLSAHTHSSCTSAIEANTCLHMSQSHKNDVEAVHNLA